MPIDPDRGAGEGGSGDVVGPGTSVADHIATFADASGEAIQDSGVSVAGDAIVFASGGSVTTTADGLEVSAGFFAHTQSLTNLSDPRTVLWPDAGGTAVVTSAVGSTVGAAGAASALPAAPLGYLTITLPSGASAKIPYYNT